jgi:NAD(P)-dependent dehydrogenase (short-subunit alcohol dehydrogenase family)
MQEVTGRVAVVTGAASGIGLALARRFGAAGMKVVLADIEPDPLDDAVAKLVADGVEAVGCVTDVSKAEQVDALRDATLDAFGAAHVICNNAGVGSGGAMHEVPLADWEWVLGVNLWGVIHGIRAFTPLFLAQDEGHIVNTSSLAGLTSPPFMGPYNVSKHGVVTISETMFAELAMRGSAVGVSVLCPGWVNTRINEAARNRPDGAPGADPNPVQPSEAGAIRDVLENMVRTGLDPADVADMVLDAILQERLYILTHPALSEVVLQRTERIVTGVNPPPPVLPG